MVSLDDYSMTAFHIHNVHSMCPCYHALEVVILRLWIMLCFLVSSLIEVKVKLQVLIKTLWFLRGPTLFLFYSLGKKATLASAQAIIKLLCHQQRWLAGGYDLDIAHF